ncbi:hypothetical protein CSC94_08675 [Zhengella mangrovi]|uniref:Tetratricopeptide repeat protein n=1 Tax=Zhengella mangrovi TaxID=1982044 RepID=A0A2G1QQK8_9HYPH|nr:hypothetical protein [Zhengella mangrovi]PHP67751.1 hypothetical protein CSC94_08675 [Zhengella mangrovi]
MGLRTLLLALALVLGLGLEANSAPDETLGSLLDQTVERLAANDLAGARTFSEQAESLARGLAAPDPQQFANALNNLAYVLFRLGTEPDRSRALWQEALVFLEQGGQRHSDAWFRAVANLVAARRTWGEMDAARRLVGETLAGARGTPGEAQAMSLAADFDFQAGDYVASARLFDELLDAHPGQLRPVFGALYVALAKPPTRASMPGTWTRRWRWRRRRRT